MREARDEMAWIACLMVGDVLPRQRQCADKTPCEACYERGDAILAALSSAGIDCEGWRDIESAPKDGKPILLWKESTQEHYVAAWVHGAHGPGCCTPDGFQIFRATHWRPLPLPPLASGGG